MDMDAGRMDGVPLDNCRFTHVVSLGYNCYTGIVLRRLGLLGAPMPFDWLSTTLPMVQHCIEDDFARLLDRQFYKPVDRDGQIQFKHTGYDTHWHTNFNHYDPNDGMGRYYLTCCIDRWRDMMASPEPKMFMFMNMIFEHERERYVSEFRILTEAITNRTDNATIVGLTITATGKPLGFTEACRIGDSRLFHYDAGSPFETPEDEALIDQFVREWTEIKVTETIDGLRAA